MPQPLLPPSSHTHTHIDTPLLQQSYSRPRKAVALTTDHFVSLQTRPFCKRVRELIDRRDIEGEICRLVPVGRRVCRMVPVCRLSKQICKLDDESANLAELADWSTESAD
eukprot:scaffold100658_cov72-Phaeocystis_antarctica.AAC.3